MLEDHKLFIYRDLILNVLIQMFEKNTGGLYIEMNDLNFDNIVMNHGTQNMGKWSSIGVDGIKYVLSDQNHQDVLLPFIFPFRLDSYTLYKIQKRKKVYLPF